jgi:hypothetical protein
MSLLLIAPIGLYLLYSPDGTGLQQIMLTALAVIAVACRIFGTHQGT